MKNMIKQNIWTTLGQLLKSLDLENLDSTHLFVEEYREKKKELEKELKDSKTDH